MAAEFDIARVVDLIAQERKRADHAQSEADRLEVDDRHTGGTTPSVQAKILSYRTAYYWHLRTIRFLESAVPAAKNWEGKAHVRQR